MSKYTHLLAYIESENCILKVAVAFSLHVDDFFECDPKHTVLCLFTQGYILFESSKWRGNIFELTIAIDWIFS